MKNSLRTFKTVSTEEMKKLKEGAYKDGAILRKILAANKGHDPLWPEDQYCKGSAGATDRLYSNQEEKDKCE